jgi:hypothetical protein
VFLVCLGKRWRFWASLWEFCFIGRRTHFGTGSLLAQRGNLGLLHLHTRREGVCSICKVQREHRLVIGSNQTDPVLTLFPFWLFHMFEDAFNFP